MHGPSLVQTIVGGPSEQLKEQRAALPGTCCCDKLDLDLQRRLAKSPDVRSWSTPTAAHIIHQECNHYGCIVFLTYVTLLSGIYF